MRKAKIVTTIGPSTESYEQIVALVDAGVDVARLNLSHGDRATHEQVYAHIRKAAEKANRNVAILADLQGPKIRLGRFADGPHELAKGDTFVITTREVEGTKEICGTTYPGLAADVSPGDPLLIDDGRVRLEVVEVRDGCDVVATVVVPGFVSNNKGINLPGAHVSVPALSKKDEEDLRWALDLGVDFIALSFVRTAADYDVCKEIMDEAGRVAPVIAKVEKPQAVENLAEIVDAFDGIMVARGDLGVELPLEEVPLVQKQAIEMCRTQAKPVIVATQVLESMISSPVPTRAEASDCANAVLDGADAVMLSGETSIGDHPITTVRTMARIIEHTEREGIHLMAPFEWQPHSRGGVITEAAKTIAASLNVKLLVCFTQSGDSARRMARLRAEVPVLAFTPDPHTRAQLAISWGVHTSLVEDVKTTDEAVYVMDQALREMGAAEPGDYAVVVSGAPLGVPGTTNSILVHKVE